VGDSYTREEILRGNGKPRRAEGEKRGAKADQVFSMCP
jgi:hypothetical protein